jgi:Protein CHAPERONE-LIKE PROTEIN OF POR1-like
VGIQWWGMSNQNDYETLGIAADASFEAIQAARTQMAKQHAADPMKLQAIEKAYDALLMERLRLRQEGKIAVPDGVRFAENQVAAPKSNGPSISLPTWNAKFSATPQLWDWLAPSITYLSLIGLAIATPAATQTLLGIGTGAAIFFVYRKQNRILWAIVFAFAGLLLGSAIGLPIAKLVVAQLPTLKLALGAVASWVALGILWLVSVLLK